MPETCQILYARKVSDFISQIVLVNSDTVIWNVIKTITHDFLLS